MKYIIVAFVLVLGGCSGSKETATPQTDRTKGSSEVDPYERSFVPSDHDPEDKPGRTQNPQDRLFGANSLDTAAEGTPEMIQGYRVQLLATTDIDEVSTRKSTMEDAFPAEWFYVEFDPPVYKLRAGNFPSRYEADRFARTLVTRGVTDAWAVPERVFKNPPPVPPRPLLSPAPADSARGELK